MIDSAKQCIENARFKKTKSVELHVRWSLVDARIAQITDDYAAVKVAYDTAFALIKRHRPSFRIEARAYMQAFLSHAYYYDCQTGQSKVDEFILMCKAAQDDSLLMQSYLFKAQFLECLGKDTAYNMYLRKAYAIAKDRTVLLGPYFTRMGRYHFYFDRPAKAIEFALLADAFYQSSGRSKHIINLYADFADAYEEIADFERSKEYLLKMKPYMDKTIDEDAIDYYNTLGWIYYRNGEMTEALKSIRRSVKYHQTYCPGTPQLAYPIGNLGLIYKAIGKHDSAAYFSRMSIDLFKQLNVKTGEAEAYDNLGLIALAEGNKTEAVAYFKAALALVEGTSDAYEEMQALEGLYMTYKDANPREAIEYFERFSARKIELLRKEEAIKALQLEAEFYQDKNQDHIRQLEYKSQLKSLEIERKNIRILLTSLALFIMVVVAGLIFFYWMQRKRMIQSLEESNQINQRIISMISHDFRGPLNNVKLTLELLQSEDIEMGEFAILSKDLYRQSADLALMFDSFVCWAISQRDGYIPARIPFKWSDVVEEVISISYPLAKLKNIRLNLHAHSSVQVETDRMASSLILRNLLSNAIKYSHHNSIIEIEYHLDKEVVHTTIKDYGIGMSEEKLQKILTTGDGSILGANNEYGAGLGLRMVIKYVRGIGGQIHAESKEGEGTSFVITIPLSLDHSH